MRRLFFSIALPFVLFTLGWAQRGGGFHGGASAGGMRGGGFHGGAGPGGMRGGFHGGAPAFRGGAVSSARVPQSGFHSGNGSHHSNGPHLIIGGHRFRHDGFRRGRFWGYPYYGWYSPFWDWGSSSYDQQENDNYAQYQTMNEINRLADEVQELREERESRAVAPQPAPPPQQQAKLQQEDLPVILVFLDKRIQEVKNYAVANEMLVVLDGNRKKKYPLADIDLAATMKLNDERGVDFEVPNPVIEQ
ncbi:MAG TPA: hypothetical protein VH114_11170 [Candidatus Acidoferrum sp.]|nr:hypothetical protein [Candidatus Acidoferrum sp.]